MRWNFESEEELHRHALAMMSRCRDRFVAGDCGSIRESLDAEGPFLMNWSRGPSEHCETAMCCGRVLRNVCNRMFGNRDYEVQEFSRTEGLAIFDAALGAL